MKSSGRTASRTRGATLVRAGAWAVAVLALLLVASVPASAAVPPERINYQGVLRDASDHPLDGSYAMTFRLWSAETGGDEILIDEHLGGVTVTGGLFSVAIGTGSVSDGSGPGTYTALSVVFKNYTDVWLEVQVEAEVLSPRVRVEASPYALNTTYFAGQTANHFLDVSSTTQTKSGTLILTAAAYGIQSHGGTAGGYFKDDSGSGEAYVATGNEGMDASGSAIGGYFHDTDSSGYAYAGYGDYGTYAEGNSAGGYFKDKDGSGYAYTGYGDYGIYAKGNTTGGYFEDLTGGGNATVGTGGYGIQAHGSSMGGYFSDTNDGAWSEVGYSTWKILGNGGVSFIQNHPDDPGLSIVYTAPEGDETAVYTRGTARLVDGVARVPLGETFRWVTNPDIGLTAYVTPRDIAVPLAVTSLTTTEMTVEGPAGGPTDATFDYIVYGLRIGFEETSVVQEKQREAYIPSMKSHREMYRRRPELRRYDAVERFKGMQAGIAGTDAAAAPDFRRAEKLKAAIHEYDPAVDGPVETAGPQPASPAIPGQSVSPAAASEGVDTVTSTAEEPTDLHSTTTAVTASAPTRLPQKQAVTLPANAFWLPVSEAVEAGDLLVLDPAHPGWLRRAVSAADPGVVGVAAGASRISVAGEGSDPGTEPPAGEVEAPVLTYGIAMLKVDAGYGAIQPGDLLVSSPTPGRAMRALEIVPGTILGKALEPLETGTATIRVLVMTR